jgi:V/A-type H+-transporting ATPase subunit I
MIVPMKKVSVVVQEKDASEAVGAMRTLGVLHVEHQIAPAGKDINALQDDLALINRAITILSETEFSFKKSASPKEPADWKSGARHIAELRTRYEHLQKYSLELKKAIADWQAWGDFDPRVIEDLGKKNIYLRLYQIPSKEIQNLPSEVIVKKVSAKGGIVNCLLISRQKIEIPFKALSLPKMSLSRMKQRLAEDARLLQTITDEIKQQGVYLQSFLARKKLLENELELHQARCGMGQIGNFVYLTGYAPIDVTNTLLAAAKKNKWAILVRDPSEEDLVPTLIRNPRWIALINPIFKLIEVVPGYRELDVSLWFLLFLSIFFGILIGDAAYGLIFFFLTAWAQKKWGSRAKDKSVFILFYLLSSTAVVWGLLSGTFFGQAWLPAWVKPVIPALRSDKTVQTLCFFLGALHLSIAHLWRGIVRAPSLKALAEAGWIFILWTAFFLARALILGDNLPGFAKWLLLAGATLVLFFTNPRKNIIKGLGQGLANLLLNLMGNFSDLVSYIRLFAVGLATVAVADSFNKMAMEVGFNSVFAAALSALILLVGHSLNILLGPMAVLVHGVRLNVLEFCCNHLDVKWRGFSYQPLKEEKVA